MSPRNPLIVIVASISLAMLAGCGGSSVHLTPPPTGSFSNSNLNGTYVFSASGTDSAGGFFSVTGTIQANGSGSITGGTIDVNDSSAGESPLQAITSGSTYSVTADGRGTAILKVPTLPSFFGGQLGLDFVLLSKSRALVTQFDNNATGSGTIDLQSTVTQAQLAGSYAFTLSGIDSSSAPFATVGSFTLDASGVITAGVEDFNDNLGFPFANYTLAGSLVLDAGGGTGAATLTAASSTNVNTFGTLHFDVYVIDATHVKLIETDFGPILTGDAFTQQGASISAGSMVFTMGGGTTNGPIATGGLMTSDGNGMITSGSQDINNAGLVASQPLSFTGNYASAGSVGGRALLNLSGFSGATQFVIYPSSGGLQMLEIDGLGLLSGAASVQTSTSLASSQGYGLDLSAVNLGSIVAPPFEEDDIAEFTNNNGSFSGVVDVNDQGLRGPRQAFNCTYTADSTNSGRAVVSCNTFTLVSYVVSTSTVLFIEVDQTQVGLGAFQLQSASAAALDSAHVAAMRAAAMPHAAWRHK